MRLALPIKKFSQITEKKVLVEKFNLEYWLQTCSVGRQKKSEFSQQSSEICFVEEKKGIFQVQNIEPISLVRGA